MRTLTVLLGALVVAACSGKDDTDTGADGIVAEVADEDGDGFSEADGDCNDADASIFPGGVEVCDGIDNDCNGEVDEGVTSTFYADTDGDGFGDPGSTTEACSEPTGYVGIGNDCDDDDGESYPGAGERCDGEDNDCDGDVDEEVVTEWHADADGDGYGDADSVIEDCDPPAGYTTDTSDCDDLDATAYPGAEEVCDEADNDCDTLVDEDVTTTYYQDADEDSYGLSDATTEACSRPAGYAARAGDCDDGADEISPAQVELCDDIDNNCDGTTDEDTAADAATWYADADSDGYGDASRTDVSCDQPTGYVSDSTDCDDSTSAANPGAAEVCDDIDNDCDGESDEDSATDAATWYADNDGDGYGGSSSTTACAQPSGFADNSDDCDDGDSGTSPGAAEVCDGDDNDCDGTTDEGVTTTYYADADSDGQGDPGSTTEACAAPSGYVTTALDCDDTDAEISPNATEFCDEVDNDCDGSTDESDAVDAASWHPDSDGDGYGDADAATEACDAPSGYISDDSDCDDGDAAVNPGAVEDCGDGVDNDCDGTDDNGLLGDYEECAGYSCDDILSSRTDAPADGAYWIDPSGSDAYEVYCDMTNESGGWTLLAIFTNNDAVNWAPTSAYWVTAGEFGDPSDPDTNADAKSQAFDDLPVDEVMIINYPSTVGVVSSTGCIGSNTLLDVFQTDSENDSDCAQSCSTATVASPWSGQSYQDSTLRFRCTDYNGTLYYSNGYIVSTDDNSMITTMNNGSYYDYNFGLGAGYGATSSGYMADWDQSTSDFGDDSDTDQVLLLGR